MTSPRIWFRYQSVRQPPAPFASIAVSSPDGSRTRSQVPAQLDSAADRTVIPASFVEQLGLIPGQFSIQITGLGGNVELLPVFQVQLRLPTFRPLLVDVVAHHGEVYVLLGRDVLNRYKVTLDGPDLGVTIEEV